MTLGSLTDQGFASQERIEQFVHQVAQKKFDIIALQEVWTANEDYLLLWRAFAGKHGFTMSVTPRTNAKPDGCAMLVRQPALACEFSAYDYDDWGSRIVQVGKLRLPGLAEPLCVMNTHLTFPHASAHDPPMRRQQGRKLAELVRTHTQPLCVVGDFNGALSDPAVHSMALLAIGIAPTVSGADSAGSLEWAVALATEAGDQRMQRICERLSKVWIPSTLGEYDLRVSYFTKKAIKVMVF